MSKQIRIEEAVKTVENGSLIALGGNALNRSPIAFVEELIQQEKNNLAVIKTAGALDVDLLATAKVITAVYGGYIGFETFGLAPSYRKGVQNQEIIAYEHACASVIAGLRASIYGVPFQPINGFQGSDLPQLTGQIQMTVCPFTNEEVAVAPALRPDVAIIHVHRVDQDGNAYIDGAIYEDELMVKAAKKVIITAEEVIDSSDWWTVKPQIPGFLVDHIVEVKNGAAPGSCASLYPINEAEVQAYLKDPAQYIDSRQEGKVYV